MAEGHKRPAPDEGRATDPEAERVQSEDAGRRRDVGEGHGEAGVDAKRSPQLLPVAEPGQVTNVGMVGFFLQLVPLPRAWRPPETFVTEVGGKLSLVAVSVNESLRLGRVKDWEEGVGEGPESVGLAWGRASEN